MENAQQPKHNENVEGYKVTGDGNVPNTPPRAGNKSFEKNPHKPIHKSESDIPGKEFNIGDKAYSDSSQKDFIKTVSSLHHADPEDELDINLDYKMPDGDR